MKLPSNTPTELVHLVRLVRQFDEHRDSYRRGDYNETQLRRDLLDLTPESNS